MNLLQYFFEVSLAWMAFYTIYLMLLRRETFFTTNRWYLLTSLILGLITPLIKQLPYTIVSELPAYGTLQFSYPVYIANAFAITENNSINHFNLNQVLIAIYIVGVVISLIKFTKGLLKIYSIYQSSEKKVTENYTLAVSERVELPFSFLKSIYVNPRFLKSESFSKILKHEITHVNHNHSYDILLIQLISIIFWWNPIVILYKRGLKETHEYMADAMACSASDLKNYGQILLGHSSSGIVLALTHQFFNSHLKNRFNMLYKKKSAKHKLFRYTLMVPCLLGLAILFSAQTIINNENLPDGNENSMINLINNFTDDQPAKKNHPIAKSKYSEIITIDSTKEIFKVVEEMPRFPGCENVEGGFEKKKCANQKMFDFILANLKYPKEAQKNNTTGKALIKFVVDKKGNLKDISIQRDLKDGCGAEAKRVVESMNHMDSKWIPGKQGGKIVEVEMILPFIFEL